MTNQIVEMLNDRILKMLSEINFSCTTSDSVHLPYQENALSNLEHVYINWTVP